MPSRRYAVRHGYPLARHTVDRIKAMLLLEDKRFYIYCYLDPRKPGIYNFNGTCLLFEPFYVGKGHGDRKFHHLYNANNVKFNSKPLINKIRKLLSLGMRPIICDLFNYLTEKEANDKEVAAIKFFGRRDLGRGTLLNFTDGGEGACGVVRSAEYRRKMSVLHKGKRLSDKTKEMISVSKAGRILSDEHCRKISASLVGRPVTKESREKMRLSRKKYFQDNPEVIEKIGLQHRGKKVSFETRVKIKEKRKLQVMRPFSKETIVKMREVALQRPPITEATKLKMREAALQRPPITEATRVKMKNSWKKRKLEQSC